MQSFSNIVMKLKKETLKLLDDLVAKEARVKQETNVKAI